jgi:hypothetical protein
MRVDACARACFSAFDRRRRGISLTRLERYVHVTHTEAPITIVLIKPPDRSVISRPLHLLLTHHHHTCRYLLEELILRHAARALLVVQEAHDRADRHADLLRRARDRLDDKHA